MIPSAESIVARKDSGNPPGIQASHADSVPGGVDPVGAGGLGRRPALPDAGGRAAVSLESFGYKTTASPITVTSERAAKTRRRWACARVTGTIG